MVVDYCTSFDIQTRPELLQHYSLVVTVGHDEYWSWEMRDNIEQFVTTGGTMIVLSGNSVWWQIRYEEGDAITCYKLAEDDPAKSATPSRVTVNWYESIIGRPETLMTGVSFKYGAFFNYEGSGSKDAPFFTIVKQHPVLQNTNLNVDDTFGKYLNNVGGRPTWKDGWLTVIGYETDARPTPIPDAPLPENLNWRADWQEIIPIDQNVSSAPGVLFYDKYVGEAEFHGIDALGKLTPRKFHQGWRTSWSEIVPGVFGKSSRGALLFYDRDAGVGEFYSIEADGGISLLRAHDGWRQSWNQIVPGNFGGSAHTDILFYDRAVGQGEFYATDGLGNIALLQSHSGWRSSWDLIVPGNFGGNNFSDLLFYDRSAGVGEFYSTDGHGNLGLLGSQSGWRSSWDQILSLRLSQGRSALLFYDRNAGTGEFYATDGSGGIALLKTHTDWRTTWKKIVPLRLDNSNRAYLFFYEEETGYAELYSADAQGDLHFVHSYTNPAFTLIAASTFAIDDLTREYASLGILRIGSGRVFTASTTDWSFGLSQSQEHWSVVDQITANVLYLYGSAPQIVHGVTQPFLTRAADAARHLDVGISARRGRERSI
jgi:hypothetical protein